MSHVKTNCDKNENIKLDKSGVKLLRQVLYEIENSLYCPKEDKEMKLEEMSNEELRRKRDQAWEMAGLARQDRDYKDAERRTKEAKAYEQELRNRR